MSTRIAKITGVREKGDGSFDKVTTDLYLTRFYGGKQGRMLQLTMSNRDGYVQLTQEQVQELAEILNNTFDDKIYPSE